MSRPEFRVMPEALRHWAQHDPFIAAYVFVDSQNETRRVLTRADVFRLASRFAAILRRHDVRRGEVVVNTLPNSPERVVTDLGAIMAGAVTMNGQIFLADGEDFLGSLRRSSAAAVVLDPLEQKGAAAIFGRLQSGIESLTKGRDQCDHSEESSQPPESKALAEESSRSLAAPVNLQSLPSLRLVFRCLYFIHDELPSLMDMLEAQTESYVNEDITPDDLAWIWTTSGTTGFSKLVPHTHRRLLHVHANVGGICGAQRHPVEDNDVRRDQAELVSNVRKAELVLFNNSRLGWSGGYPGEVICLGATRVMLDLHSGPPSDLARALWRAAAEEGCTRTFLLPVHLNMILERTDLWAGQTFRFRMISTAGQPIHAALVRRTVDTLADAVLVAYGSTDTGGVSTKMVTRETADLYDDFNCGQPLPGVEVKVVLSDQLDDHGEEDDSEDELKAETSHEEMLAAPGQLGEIFVRSSRTLDFYYNQEEATRQALRPGGWVTVGDVGYLDQAGDLHVVCRAAHAIQRGAYVLYPGWLEARLRQHPALREVLVVPVPDPVQHEELCACVVPRPEAEVTAEELRRWSEGLFLTGKEDHMTAVPKYFLFFPGGLPLTPLGKTCRRSAAAEALKRLGMSSASFQQAANG